MRYQVYLDKAPAYEMITNFNLFMSPTKTKYTELGPNWIKEVTDQLDSSYLEELKKYKTNFCMDVLMLLVWKCPNERRSGTDFLNWLDETPLPELIKLTSDYLSESELGELNAQLSNYTNLLREWNSRYFSDWYNDAKNYKKIEIEHGRCSHQLEMADEIDFIESLTTGLRIEQDEELKQVVMIPSVHTMPISLYSKYKSMIMITFPVNPEPLPSGYPPVSLLRLAKSLADESRLRILYFLADGPKRFIDIVQYVGLSKSVVHNHLMNLRISHLIRVHIRFDATERYSLNPSAVSLLQSELSGFFYPSSCGQ